MITDDSDLKGFTQHLIKVVVKQGWLMIAPNNNPVLILIIWIKYNKIISLIIRESLLMQICWITSSIIIFEFDLWRNTSPSPVDRFLC
jgi:hypothetical protein